MRKTDKFRPMPVNYWPMVTVQADDGTSAMGFSFTREEWEDCLIPYLMSGRLEALRQRMWQAAEFKRLGIAVDDPKPLPTATEPAAWERSRPA